MSPPGRRPLALPKGRRPARMIAPEAYDAGGAAGVSLVIDPKRRDNP